MVETEKHTNTGLVLVIYMTRLLLFHPFLPPLPFWRAVGKLAVAKGLMETSCNDVKPPRQVLFSVNESAWTINRSVLHGGALGG